MDKKKLIFSYVVQILAFASIAILFVPILKAKDHSMSILELIINTGKWVYMEEYLFGIAGLIIIICSPMLLITTELCKLSACGVIKCKKLDTALYIINIVLTGLLVCTIVNYFLGLGRTMGMSGLVLFKGRNNFVYTIAYFYLHVVFSVSMLIFVILNKQNKKA